MHNPIPRSEIPDDYYATRAELKEGLGELDTKISETKTEIIKWTVGTGIAVGAVIVVAVGVLLNFVGQS